MAHVCIPWNYIVVLKAVMINDSEVHGAWSFVSSLFPNLWDMHVPVLTRYPLVATKHMTWSTVDCDTIVMFIDAYYCCRRIVDISIIGWHPLFELNTFDKLPTIPKRRPLARAKRTSAKYLGIRFSSSFWFLSCMFFGKHEEYLR